PRTADRPRLLRPRGGRHRRPRAAHPPDPAGLRPPAAARRGPPVMTARAILAPGRNCLTVADARQAGLLIDARDYFRAFYEAARRARRSVLIAGWRFNSDV